LSSTMGMTETLRIVRAALPFPGAILNDRLLTGILRCWTGPHAAEDGHRRRPAADRRVRRTVRPLERLGDEIHRMLHVDTGCTEVKRAARVCAGDHLRPGTLDGCELALANLAGQLGLQRRVGPAGPAAQPLVVEFDHVRDCGEHGAHGHVRTLHVT
jgi:hypothetical protein